MSRVLRIIAVLAVLLVGLSALEADASNQILNIRHWVAPDHTRIVIDTSEVPDYTVEKSKEFVRIDFRSTNYSKDLPDKSVLNKPGVRDITVTRPSEGIVRIEIALADHIDTNVFSLSKIEAKPDRVVLDIELPEMEKKEPAEPEQAKKAKKDWIIVIDPGHGGEDPGAVGRGGTQEKDVVLKISRMLRNNLNKREGYRAYLTRNGDYYVSFSRRLKIARQYGADLFLSIHADAARNREAQGASVYCLSLSGASSEAARLLAVKENLADIMGGAPNGESSDASDPIVLNMFQTNTINTSKIYGYTLLNNLSRVSPLKFDTVQGAPFRVLKLPEIPSLLIETGYISNRKEEKNLRSRRHQSRIADILTNAVAEILPVEPTARPVRGVVVANKEPEPPKKESTQGRADAKAAAEPSVKDKGVDQPAAGVVVAKKEPEPPKKESTQGRADAKAAAEPAVKDKGVDQPAAGAVVAKKEPDPPKKESMEDRTGTTARSSVAVEGEEFSEAKIQYYRVRRGDTLEKIAKKHDASLAALLKLNKMNLGDPLYAGRRIKISSTDMQKPNGYIPSRSAEASARPLKTSETSVAREDVGTLSYRVKKGDTLAKIAKKHDTPLNVLLKINKMKLRDPLLAGQKIIIRERPAEMDAPAASDKAPSGKKKKGKLTYHRVMKGETLETIARKNGTTVGQLRQLNRMKPSDPLLADRKLKLPVESSL